MTTPLNNPALNSARTGSRPFSDPNMEMENHGESDDEELRQLKDLTTEDEGELEEDFDQEVRLGKLKRGSLLSRKNTVLSITQSLVGFEFENEITSGGGRRFTTVVTAAPSSDAESSASSQGGGGGDWKEQQIIASPELPPEYWQVGRLVKYIKAGNQTATIIALSALRDYNLRDDVIQRAIRDSGGMEVLLNILETDESRCKVASLQVIRDVTYNSEISRNVFNMRGLETLVGCLKEPAKDVRLLAAEAISNICKLRKARRAMRMSDGINRLVDMLETADKDRELARCASMALWSLAKSTKNKEAIRKAGAIPLLSKLMMTEEVDVVIPVVGILQECASQPTFREAIRTQGLLPQFVFGLNSESAELVQFCAKAIYMCAEDEESREIVYHLGAVEPLLRIIQNIELRKNKPLLAAATGAIWKCSAAIFRKDGGDSSISSIIMESGGGSGGGGGLGAFMAPSEMSTEGIIHLLVSLLSDQPEDVLVNVSGALYQIAKADLEYNAPVVKKAGAIGPLLSLLTRSNTELLVNTTQAMGELARDADCRVEMENLDGFRLVWSLLKHESPLVQCGAAWAICPYVQNSPDAGQLVRNYVGGFESIVKLLASPDTEVLSAVSFCIGCIAKNVDNLSIMSDHAVVEYLARLASTPRQEDNVLKQCLATAIAHCCTWGENSREFGKRHAVGPICSYLTCDNPEVHRAAAAALCALSSDPRNCVTIHQCGVVPLLINLSGSDDDELRVSVAGIMSNIRKLALCAENVRLI